MPDTGDEHTDDKWEYVNNKTLDKDAGLADMAAVVEGFDDGDEAVDSDQQQRHHRHATPQHHGEKPS